MQMQVGRRAGWRLQQVYSRVAGWHQVCKRSKETSEHVQMQVGKRAGQQQFDLHGAAALVLLRTASTARGTPEATHKLLLPFCSILSSNLTRNAAAAPTTSLAVSAAHLQRLQLCVYRAGRVSLLAGQLLQPVGAITRRPLRQQLLPAAAGAAAARGSTRAGDYAQARVGCWDEVARAAAGLHANSICMQACVARLTTCSGQSQSSEIASQGQLLSDAG